MLQKYFIHSKDPREEEKKILKSKWTLTQFFFLLVHTFLSDKCPCINNFLFFVKPQSVTIYSLFCTSSLRMKVCWKLGLKRMNSAYSALLAEFSKPSWILQIQINSAHSANFFLNSAHLANLAEFIKFRKWGSKLHSINSN